MSLTAFSPEAPPGATRALQSRSVPELLAAARADLAEAAATRLPGLRFASAHRGALHAAAAVVAARYASGLYGRGSLWCRAAEVAPELDDWCASFAGGAETRAKAEAGVPVAVTPAEADALCARAAQFVDVVTVLLGFPLEAESPGDLTDSDLPPGLSAILDLTYGRMSRTEQAEFGIAWTRAVQAAKGANLTPVAAQFCGWRPMNLDATPAECGAKLIELVQAVAR